MKRIAAVFLSALMCLLSTACGYNAIMVDILSDPESYGTFTVTITEIKSTDEEITDVTDEAFAKNNAFIYVTFASYEDAALFLGSTPNRDLPLENYGNRLEVTAENNKMLAESGFYDNVKVGDTITVRASHFIYMDGNFFYIASVALGDTEYLNFDTGLANIMKMMKANSGQ